MPVVIHKTKIVPRVVHHQVVANYIEHRSTPWGQLVQEIRAEQGLSQRQLAELSGVDRNVLRRIERGESAGDMDVLSKLMSVFGYEFDIFSVQKSVF